MRQALIVAGFIAGGLPLAAPAEEASVEFHGQATYLRQYKRPVSASYLGANSLSRGGEASYTLTATMYVGARLGDATELYLNPEFVQAVAISGLHGLGGFSNGEVQRGVGPDLIAYRARLFLRRTWNLRGEWEPQESGQNQLKTRYTEERAVLTAGNLSVLDVFDAIDYSRDPRTQFMNWASLTYGAWDYPADARGYTWGAALEYITPAWQARAGRFLVPVESNGLSLDRAIVRRHGDVVEFEVPYRFAGRRGIFRALAFRNRVNAGAFADAIALGAATAATPDLTLVRRLHTKRGLGLGTQLELSEDVGAFVRAGWNDGRTETYMFTEIDGSLSTGVLVKGGLWGRAPDSAGIQAYVNALGRAHRDYLASGGLGFFLGDGQLRYGSERILEGFYSLAVAKGTSVSLGYQHVTNPGYNRDRGTANFFALRLHWEL